MKTTYVDGFLFSDDGDKVLLIRKKRPIWQAGKLNGIGGKVEFEETPLDAMSREFLEETGVHFDDWELTIQHEGPDWVVFYYRGYSTAAIEEVLAQTTYPTDEIPELTSLNAAEVMEQCVRNARWAIPLSNDRVGVIFPVLVKDCSPV